VRILVAEDNETNREVALAQLHKLGYQATAVSNGAEAVEAVLEGGFDLVLMDWQMPVMDGVEATRRIRLSKRAHLPIIALTASAMSGDRERCLREGMNDYLSKPLELEPLADLLARWLPVSAASVNPEAPIQSAEGPPKTVFDAEALLRRLAGDRQLAGKMIRSFLESTPANLNGLRTRLDQTDAPGAISLVHTLKGSSATVAAVGLLVVALAMEVAGKQGEWDRCGQLLPRAVEEFDRFKDTLERAGWV
jgi:CheY-like chemotaxis protein/HPt (histidine-containing phosphotransfer) domain-containing protein